MIYSYVINNIENFNQ